MKRFIISLAILTASLFAAPECNSLYTGAAAYKAGDFATAVDAWQTCVDNGYKSGDLYYNLGNAYFREGRVGFAILYYESALKLDPTNDDYLHNLKYAQTKTKDKVANADEEENPILTFFFKAHHFLSLKQQLYAILILIWVIIAICVMRVLSANPRTKNALYICVFPVALFLGLTAISAGYKIYMENTNSKGVVTAKSADITSGPADSYQTLNMLSEGTEVEVLGVKDGWVHLQLGSQVNGFAKISEVGIVK